MTATQLSTSAAAALAGVSRSTICRWCRIGAVQAHRDPQGRWRIDPASLIRRVKMSQTDQQNADSAVKVITPTDITIVVEGESAYLTAPYNANANTSYRNIGGQWDRGRRAWRFAARDVELVRDVLREHFGRDDRPTRVVDVRVNLEEICDGREDELWFGGRLVARRPSRDAHVRLGADVVVIQGEFAPAGGSIRYPELGPVDGMVLEVRDVPADHPDLAQDGVTVLGSDDTPELTEETRAALEEERAALLARLAEIESLLGAQ